MKMFQNGGEEEVWRDEVHKLLKENYGLERNDVEICYQPIYSPEGYTDWYAQKYDLDKLNEPWIHTVKLV